MAIVTKSSKGEKIFDGANTLFLVLICITIILPFIHILSISFSTPQEANRLGLHFWPRERSLEAYQKVFASEYILKGYVNTIFRTVVGTAFSLLLTSFGGYVISKKYIPHRNFWTSLIVFTMFFNGGIVPRFILIKNLGFLDSYLALILPNAIMAFHLLIMRNYFMTLPESLEESAKIDGATDLYILFKIILPLSKPMLATVGLWIAVRHWNSWLDCLMFIRDVNKFVLQIVLRRIVLEGSAQMIDLLDAEQSDYANPESVKAAAIYVATVPILCVYPFIQKYFVKGVMVGSLKG